MGRVYVGCSGWNYAHWRDVFYPHGLGSAHWLEHYSEHFETVEVNATFYRLPTRSAVAGWARGTPDGFVFAVKASRYLTHVKRLRDLGPGWRRFHERIEPLADARKLGPVLWQLPENFHRDDDRLADALEALPPGRHCFEFRHESWFCPEVEKLLRSHRVALVIGDEPTRDFQTHSRPARWTYVRFHRGRGKDGNYTPKQLREWSGRIRNWSRRGDTYAYFNDDWGGHAIREAHRLRKLLT
jgi:uncharacterized protein YecE (DUF72 family)